MTRNQKTVTNHTNRQAVGFKPAQWRCAQVFDPESLIFDLDVRVMDDVLMVTPEAGCQQEGTGAINHKSSKGEPRVQPLPTQSLG